MQGGGVAHVVGCGGWGLDLRIWLREDYSMPLLLGGLITLPPVIKYVLELL
jgi:hypothetical protein